MVHKCGSCGHIRRIELVEYKKPGRPVGSKNNPIRIAKKHGISQLDAFTVSDGE
jgi:hypothetical protein